ncbi:MAG: hypothetical protein DIZ80_07120 [endosymbiont of Galathealinum brachiosum]|uniref:Copper resistance protein D domain-containing protein n=1 Tax=endosymbiont of Galathealinum brachiosum TaxID=2200906 RepID=A0A370DH84_9GAMM|nr:MAG: hypothetical protein DIZ80_07120 [endosymbiont of Galathealinum brachiosum]
MLSILSLLHVIAAVIWVGGMVFAHTFLRPAIVETLEPPARLTLWVSVFKRFFLVVWLCVILLPVTGYFMIFSVWGSMSVTPLYVHAMNGIGMIMIIIYLYIFFLPYKNLRMAVINQQWPVGAQALAKIRFFVGVNILLGLAVIVIAAGGRFLV